MSDYLDSSDDGYDDGASVGTQGTPTIGGAADGNRGGWDLSGTLDSLSGLFKTGVGAYNSWNGKPISPLPTAPAPRRNSIPFLANLPAGSGKILMIAAVGLVLTFLLFRRK